MTLRTYEDCLTAVESVAATATGEVAQVLGQLRDFLKSRIERSSARKTDADGEPSPDIAGMRKRLAPERVAAPVKPPTPTRFGDADLEKGALD